jgi:hypothetical protein
VHRACGSTTKHQLCRRNGIDEQRSGFYADSRRARVQAIQHPEFITLCLVAICDFLKERASYLRLVAQNNKADAVNVTPITVVASVDTKLLENLIDMEEIYADSVDDCTDESEIEFLESTQERDASVKAEFIKAEVLANVTFALSDIVWLCAS